MTVKNNLDLTLGEHNMNKVSHAKDLIKNAIEKYPNIAVGCSFGKDSMVTIHIAREVEPNIPIFSIMTQYKPKETFEYLVEMNDQMNLNVKVYMVADEIPPILAENNIETVLLPTEEFENAQEKTTGEIYFENPDECCRLLKVDPTREAVKNLDAWIAGLRNTEGRIREDYKEVEFKGGLVKINPILTFTEEDIWDYMDMHNIPIHPWYTKELPDGKKYRSLGCAPCTNPITPSEPERMGRWQTTSKCGGECGIHTQVLKEKQIID